MDNEMNNIDKLYAKKFSKFESQISAEDWTKLSTKLSKTNFLKFSFTTFNAYFLSAIVTFAAAATYFGVTNINLSNKNKKLEEKIEILQEKQIKNDIEPLLIDTFDIEGPQHEEQFEVDNDNIIATKPIETTTANKEFLEKQQEKDSINTKIDTTSILEPDTQSIPQKKIIRVKKMVYVKQNKVIVKDTVTVKKKE